MKPAAYSFFLAALIATAATAQDAPAPKQWPNFAASDTDRDGAMTQGEWDASGRSPKRFARVDTDSDGKVTRAELNAATAAAKAKREADAAAKP